MRIEFCPPLSISSRSVHLATDRRWFNRVPHVISAPSLLHGCGRNTKRPQPYLDIKRREDVFMEP